MKDDKTKINILFFSIFLILLISVFSMMHFVRADDESDDNEGMNSYSNQTESEDNFNADIPATTPDLNEQLSGQSQAERDPSEETIQPQSQIIDSKTIQPSADKTAIPQKQNTSNIQNNNNIQTINEWKDSDNDGVADKLDKYPGEDDFAFMVKDLNQNGIADELELLIL
jgi:hypothetical protein